MPAEIVPGLFRLPGVVGVNSFLWYPRDKARRDGVPLLFDCGWPWSGRGLVASLVALGVEPEAIQTLVVTHDDMDHTGRLPALQAVSGALVIAHEIEAQSLLRDEWRHLPPRADPLSLAVRLVEAQLRRWPRRAVRAGLHVQDGSPLPGGWKAIHSPGHTAGHTSYFHPERGILIAGDALGASPGGQLRFPMATYCVDSRAAVRSIRKLAELAPQVVCCGHGPALYDASGPLRNFADRLSD